MADAKFRITCPHCKTTVLYFDLWDEKPLLCSGCRTLVAHPGQGGTHPGLEMMRSMERGNLAFEQLHSQMMGGPDHPHRFIGIEQMSDEDITTATVSIVKECFKRMKLPDDNWPLRLDSILDLLGIGRVVLPPETKARDEKLRKLLGYD